MGFNEFQDGGNFLNSINDSVKVLLLEIRDSNLDIRENGFGISNAGVDILEALGVQSSVEDTSNNEFELGGSQVVDLCNLSLRFLSEDSLGSSLSNLKSEVVVVLGFIVMDSGLDFLKDIFLLLFSKRHTRFKIYYYFSKINLESIILTNQISYINRLYNLNNFCIKI